MFLIWYVSAQSTPRTSLKSRLAATSSDVLCSCCLRYLTTGWEESFNDYAWLRSLSSGTLKSGVVWDSRLAMDQSVKTSIWYQHLFKRKTLRLCDIETTSYNDIHESWPHHGIVSSSNRQPVINGRNAAIRLSPAIGTTWDRLATQLKVVMWLLIHNAFIYMAGTLDICLVCEYILKCYLHSLIQTDPPLKDCFSLLASVSYDDCCSLKL